MPAARREIEKTQFYLSNLDSVCQTLAVTFIARFNVHFIHYIWSFRIRRSIIRSKVRKSRIKIRQRMRISLLVYSLLSIAWSIDGQRHSVSYGACGPSRSPYMTFVQEINLRNHGIVRRSPRTFRRMVESLRDMFQPRRPTTTLSPALTAIRISHLFTFPPFVSSSTWSHWHFRHKIFDLISLFWQGKRNIYPIKCIRIIDQFTNGTGAYAKIVGGGIDRTWVQIQSMSQERLHIHFNIIIIVDKERPIATKGPRLSPYARSKYGSIYPQIPIYWRWNI